MMFSDSKAEYEILIVIMVCPLRPVVHPTLWERRVEWRLRSQAQEPALWFPRKRWWTSSLNCCRVRLPQTYTHSTFTVFILGHIFFYSLIPLSAAHRGVYMLIQMKESIGNMLSQHSSFILIFLCTFFWLLTTPVYFQLQKAFNYQNVQLCQDIYAILFFVLLFIFEIFSFFCKILLIIMNGGNVQIL